jgi:hypothetical protein
LFGPLLWQIDSRIGPDQRRPLSLPIVNKPIFRTLAYEKSGRGRCLIHDPNPSAENIRRLERTIIDRSLNDGSFRVDDAKGLGYRPRSQSLGARTVPLRMRAAASSLLFLFFSAISTKWRIASARDGLSSCLARHLSIAFTRLDGSTGQPRNMGIQEAQCWIDRRRSLANWSA